MENSKIEWTHHTFNPWHGCMKVSAGCANCYAEAQDKRFGPSHWGPGSDRKFMSDKYWEAPLKWNRDAENRLADAKECRRMLDRDEVAPEAVEEFEERAKFERPRVFCASMADVFEDRDDLIETRTKLFDLIRATPDLDWLLLTKRPENISPLIHASFIHSRENPRGHVSTDLDWWLEKWLGNIPPENVWLGTSVENQDAADARIPHLLNVPAKVHFLSCEPLLGAVNLASYWRDCPNHQNPRGEFGESDCWETWLDGLDWVICGGESGANARAMHPNWALDLRDQCRDYDVAFHFKQHGEYLHESQTENLYEGRAKLWEDGSFSFRVGKKEAGRFLNGRTWDELPLQPTRAE